MDDNIRRTLTKVFGEIWVSNRMYETLRTVCAFGPRFAGTEGERHTHDLILERLAEYDVPHVDQWEFDYTAWQRGTCQLEILSSSPPALTPISLVGSPSTADDGMVAELINLAEGSHDTFERFADQIPGRIVVVTSDSPSGQKPIHRRDKYGWAVERGAAGFLYINHLPGFPALTGSLRPGRFGEIPAASLSHADGMALLTLLEQGPVKARLRILNSSRPARSQHVFVDIPGQTDETVVLSAHYDGHDISPSALDNGTGFVTALELARILTPYAGRFRRTIRIAFWTVEEWGVYGSDRYLESLSDEALARIAFVVNLDVTSGLGVPVWSLNGATEMATELQRYAIDVGYEYATSNEITAGSDHFPFVVRGVPAVWLRGSVPADRSSRRFILTEWDTLDKVSTRDLKEAAMVTALVLVRAATEPELPARRRSMLEVQALLREQGWEAALRAQGKWPSGEQGR